MVSVGGELPASKIVEFFHSWAHLRTDFTPVGVPTQGAFDPEDQQYYTALLILLGFFVAATLVSVLVVLVVTCCNCSRRHYHFSLFTDEFKKFRRYRWMGITCASIAILCMFACIYANVDINEAVSDTLADVDSADNKYNKAIRSTSDLSTQTVDPSEDARELLQEMTDAPSNVRDALERISSALKQFRTSLTSVVGDAPDFDFDTADVRHYNHYRFVGEFVLVALGVACFAFPIVAVVCRSHCLVIASLVLGTLVVLILGAVAGGEGGLAVGASDVCMQPTSFLLHQFADNNTYVSYYLYCDRPSPFDSDIAKATEEAQRGIIAAQRVHNYTMQHDQQHEEQAQQLLTAIRQLKTDLDPTFDNVLCANFWHDYRGIATRVCNTGVRDLAILVWSRVGACVFMLLAMLCISFASVRFERIRDLEEAFRSESGATEPLLFIHQVQYGTGGDAGGGNSSSNRDGSGNQAGGNVGSSSSGNNNDSDEDEDEDVMCKICVARPVNIRLNCGHCICNECAERVSDSCPWCRETITSRDRLIFP